MSDERSKVRAFAGRLAPFLRGRLLPAGENSSFPEIELFALRLRLHIRGGAWGQGSKYSVTAYPDTGPGSRGFASCNFSPSRPLVTLARDICRRCVEPSRAPLLEHLEAEGKRAAELVERGQYLEKIQAALGGKGGKFGSYSGRWWHCRGFEIEHEIYLRGFSDRAETVAKIRVHSFPALLQICKILKADFELHNKEKK